LREKELTAEERKKWRCGWWLLNEWLASERTSPEDSEIINNKRKYL